MFEYLRKNASSLFVKIVLGIVALVFVFWGIGSFTAKKAVNYAAVVNDNRITIQDFYKEFDNFIKNYQKQYNINITEKMIKQFHLKESVLNSLINRMLLYQEALKSGIKVTDEELRNFIISIPAFKNNGVFDRRRYVELLKMNRLTPEAFENQLRFDLTITKFQQSLGNSIIITDEELRDAFDLQTKKAKIGFLKIPYKNFSNKVKFSEKDLEAFYNSHKEVFRVPEKRDIKYVLVDKSIFLKNYKISEKKLKDYYKKNIAQFKEPEMVKARHILVKTKKEAEYILKKLKNGADFAKLAKKYSIGPSAKNGGDLGYFKRGQMVPAFDKAVFSLKKGEISDIVKTQFGYHIIKVDDIKKERTKSFKEVKKDIIKKLDNDFVNKKMDELYNKYSAKIDNITLSDIAKKFNLKIKEEKNITKNNDKLPAILVSEVFKTSLNKIDIIKGNQYMPMYFFKVVSIEHSYIPVFSKIKDKVKERFIEAKAKLLALQEAEKILKKAKTVDELKKFNYKFDTTDYVQLLRPFSEKLKNLDLSNIETLKKGAILNKVLSDDKAAYIVGIVEFSKFNKDEFNKNKDKLKKLILKEKLNFQINQLLAKLRKNSKIEINEKILN